MSYDLSAVTDALIGLVRDSWTAAPLWAELGGPATFTPTFTGLAPDAIRADGGPEVSLFLYHVESRNEQEALFWEPQYQSAGGEPVRFLPTALDLYYLLSSYSATSYNEEQQAMSVAIRLFHATPIVTSSPGAPVPWELTLTMEHRSYDELSRLWQATTAPLRMSVVYRAAVVFIPPDANRAVVKETTSFSVSVQQLPEGGISSDPALLGAVRTATYTDLDGDAVPFAHSPATVAPGQQIELFGAFLDSAAADTVFLVDADGSEVDVTAWSLPEVTASRRILQLPGSIGTPPATAPVPGVYEIRVGHGPFRSDAVPVLVAAYVNPAAGPLLPGTAPFTIAGTGFIPGATTVFVGADALSATGASPAPGQFRVSAGGNSLTVNPAPDATGTLPLRVVVSGVDSDPALWVSA